MEDTKRKIEVMKAYAEGKKIQVSCCGFDLWRDCIYEPDWDWVSCDYRVKPEEKYRPYKDYNEMVEDFCERFKVNVPEYAMPLIWVKNKELDCVHMINVFQKYNGEELMENYFNNYTYFDGSPVGKNEEEK